MTSDPVRAHVLSCTRCDLRKTCLEPQPWSGKAPVDVVIVLGQPWQADKWARPTPDHELLWTLLGHIGEWTTLSAVSCPTPGNREPTVAELAACSLNLSLQMAHINPKWVLVLGGTALKALRPAATLSIQRARLWAAEGRIFYPTWHPSHIIRNPSLLNEWRGDLEMFASMVLAGSTLEAIPVVCETCGDQVVRYSGDGTAQCAQHGGWKR